MPEPMPKADLSFPLKPQQPGKGGECDVGARHGWKGGFQETVGPMSPQNGSRDRPLLVSFMMFQVLFPTRPIWDDVSNLQKEEMA